MVFVPPFTFPTLSSKITCTNWSTIIPEVPTARKRRGDAFLNALASSVGRGDWAIHGTWKSDFSPDASDQLISFWGMQQDEADDQSHLLRPANVCVMLIDAQDNDNRVGLLYVDSTQPDAFGVNPPS